MATRVSQLPVETVVLPNTQKLRVTQLPIEVIYTLRVVGNIRMSQLPVEVIIGNVPEPSGRKKYGPVLQCI